ncbi:kinase-like protein [Lentinus tigrinus ALCF2SS1-7]|uniref:Kinase-like protein n=1 Tax=Lentinus tigrinus ALCF2SS1-6 TaxID=1328759 RepID=A0A5C2RRY0_9APHY|nr:kinase-like protein [Lentinus tigrinus ALCF2SS1-6]RPD69613.1 kinase-like protein [Lentinus tigrinus ALCF2SS1-7]
MVTDDGAQTQQQTQSTQQASQGDVVVDEHLWGYLIPCSANLRRIDFQKVKTTYRIGRNREEHKNDIILPGMKISNFHSTIEWDGDETAKSAVKVTDLSSNGTFINGEKIGKGKCKVLRDGNEVAFGTCMPQPASGGLEDYRFVFRHMACGPPSRGLYKYYDLQHELGKGSFATVMKALHKEEGKWYAVKMIQANKLRRGLSNASLNGVESNDKANNFAREINILERLQHKNICQLKEVFFESYNINLVLEWVPGGDLLDYILKRNGLPELEAQYLTYQICDALAYVHSQGIAHRDLKPENVLLTDDNPPVVKVADFGLAKVIDSMTMLRTMCGTPVYLAPEVVNQGPNKEGYDQVVDSWSVGVIVFSMLTMSTPFGEEDQNVDVKARVSNRRVDWGVLRECCPNPIAEDFIHGLLQYDPRKRMTLADARLHPWLAEQHAQAVPAPAPAPAALPAPPVPAGLPAPPRRTASPEPQQAIDASMRSIAFDGMALDDRGEPMDAEPAEPESGRQTPEYVPEDEDSQSQPQANGVHTSVISRQQSRLRRRVDIIRSAENRGEALPSPSQEMQERAAAEEAEENGAGPSRGNKRKARASLDFEASLTPMSEEDEEEEEEVEPQPVRGRGAPASKRGRGGKKAPPPSAAKRGRGRAAAPVPAIAAAPVNGDDGEAGGLRRSTRLHQVSPVKQKVARRG